MAVDVKVPTTGNAGEDAVVVEWNVAVGDDVRAGDVLVVLETAKSTVDIEAPASGRILAIHYESGDDVPEHGVLAILGEPGERVSENAPMEPAAEGSAPEGQSTAPSRSAAVGGSGEAPAASRRNAGRGAHDRVRVSPRARAYAAERGIDPTGLAGSGPFGRIVIEDVRNAEPSAPISQAGAPTSPIAEDVTTASSFDVVPVRGARKLTAQRMHDSLSNSAQVTLTRYADADRLLNFASRLREVTDAHGISKIGVNALLLYVVSRVVAKHPDANSWFSWEGIKQFHAVNLGFAVDTGQALLVPVIRGADSLSLSEIANAAQKSIDKARAGSLSAAEMEGGTFTVSNLGSLGVHWFTPVLNPPQSCILGVGASHQSGPGAPSLLPLSLTFDHRALDGAAAARLLADIAEGVATVDVLSAL